MVVHQGMSLDVQQMAATDLSYSRRLCFPLPSRLIVLCGVMELRDALHPIEAPGKTVMCNHVP